MTRCRIVSAALGPHALLTGATALWVLGILRTNPGDVEVLDPPGRCVGARDGVCVHYASDYDTIPTVVKQGLRIARAARATTDYARHEGLTPLCRAIADATRLRHCTLGQSQVQVPSRPQPIIHGDRTVAEIDIPSFDVRYGVEIDGPPHLLPAQAARDAARDRMLRRDCAWTIDRFWWFELEEDPERFTREVITRLRGLGSAAVSPPPRATDR